MDLSKVTRLEIIDYKDKNGRLFICNNVKMEASIQDDGETLKIFLDDYDYRLYNGKNDWPYLDKVPDPAKDAPLYGIYGEQDPLNNNSNTPKVIG